MEERKKNGIFYTPSILAEYLARPLLEDVNQTIFDPSYGEGALLLAAEKIIKERKFTSEINFFGCDIHPVDNLLNHLPKANLEEIDFFSYKSGTRFNTILMNPPYVRHSVQNLEKLNRYRDSIKNLNIINKKSDLWAYFLIKACSHIENGGNIGAILPWAILQADYAQPIRRWLTEIFKEIRIIAFSQNFFDNTDERIVILWLIDYGTQNETIKISANSKIDSEINYSDISVENWLSNRVLYSEESSITRMLSKFKLEHGFTNFGDHAEIKIGIVTGVVDFFIMPKQNAIEFGFEEKNLIPILKKSDDLLTYMRDGKHKLLVLVSIPENDSQNIDKFIKKGIEKKYHLRAHSMLRTPWHSVKIGATPDAFFHYRIRKTPFLVPNTQKIQSTNSIHRVYFKNLSDTEKKWIFISLLTSPSQLSIEINSKIYGNGVLKIEPGPLKNVLVYKSTNPAVNKIYNKIIKLISMEQKETASRIATNFLYKELNIPIDLIDKTEFLLSSLQNKRLQT